MFCYVSGAYMYVAPCVHVCMCEIMCLSHMYVCHSKLCVILSFSTICALTFVCGCESVQILCVFLSVSPLRGYHHMCTIQVRKNNNTCSSVVMGF